MGRGKCDTGHPTPNIRSIGPRQNRNYDKYQDSVYFGTQSPTKSEQKGSQFFQIFINFGLKIE